MNLSRTRNCVEVKRTLSTPLEVLFEAWLNPVLLQRWGPQRASIDARVGGHFRFETEGVEGTQDVHVVTGEIKELIPGQRIVKTWIYQGPLSLDEPVETLVTVEFKPKGPDQVEITIIEEGPSLCDIELRKAGREAWEAALENLSTLNESH